MTREAFADRWQKAHEAKPFHDGTFKNWSKVRDEAHPYHFQAGVHITVTPHDPDAEGGARGY